MAAPIPEALRLPAAPLLAAVDRAAGDRGVTPSALLGTTGYQAYARARLAGTVTVRQAEATCDRLGCHPYELYGAAYQRLALASAPGPLDPDATVTAWHDTTCARPGCGRPIHPGHPVGLVSDVGPCCAACCGLDAHKAHESAGATAATATPRPRESAA
jgi:hypothetical protein